MRKSLFEINFFSFKRTSVFLSLSSEDEIGKILRMLKKFVLMLSNVRCHAFFMSFRDKIVLFLYNSLNPLVQLKVRMYGFKIILRLLDTLLFFQESDSALIEIFNRSLDFSLFFDKNNNNSKVVPDLLIFCFLFSRVFVIY